MKTLNLSAEDLKTVQSILRKFIPGLTVFAFGSRVTGTAKTHSDLDLCIMSEAPITLETRAQINHAFDQAPLDFKVDVVDYAGTEASFRKLLLEQTVDITPAEKP